MRKILNSSYSQFCKWNSSRQFSQMQNILLYANPAISTTTTPPQASAATQTQTPPKPAAPVTPTPPPAAPQASTKPPPKPLPANPIPTEKDFTREVVKHVEEVSGLPERQTGRKVKIFTPCKSAMQSAPGQGAITIEFEKTEDFGNKWADPLMGWTGHNDVMRSMRLSFSTVEAAKAYCEKHGFTYEVQEAPERVIKGKSYVTKFKTRGYKPTPDEF